MAVDKRQRFGKLRANMRRLANIPGVTFLIFFVWKAVLLLLTAQPVPANDAFFYDGPVVNFLLHGRYCNPALTEVMPISATEVFSAYPPLHQLALLGWMKIAGTSALAAMWYHVFCLGIFSWVVFATLRRMNVPAVALNWAGLFLFAITFHDRPDTLAQVFGALTVWAWVRGWVADDHNWSWVAAACLVLAFCTSLQIGGCYAVLLALVVAGKSWLTRKKVPWGPVLAFVTLLAALIAFVKWGEPRWWAGFEEHLAITPSVTGWRLPSVGDLLKIGRAAAGIFLATALMIWLLWRRRIGIRDMGREPTTIVAVASLLTAFALILGCLVILTPNTIHIANYLQPLIVGCALAAWHARSGEANRTLTSVVRITLVAAWLLVSIRAIGLTTWGTLCARDFGYGEAMRQTRAELESLSGSAPVAASSAYLYELARVSPVRWVHSDWIGNLRGGRVDLEPQSLANLRPQKIILTQFDYYRRYERLLAIAKDNPDLLEVRVTNLAKRPPPDATPSLQKVLQHISWAPVIVELTWRPQRAADASN